MKIDEDDNPARNRARSSSPTRTQSSSKSRRSRSHSPSRRSQRSQNTPTPFGEDSDGDLPFDPEWGDDDRGDADDEDWMRDPEPPRAHKPTSRNLLHDYRETLVDKSPCTHSNPEKHSHKDFAPRYGPARAPPAVKWQRKTETALTHPEKFSHIMPEYRKGHAARQEKAQDRAEQKHREMTTSGTDDIPLVDPKTIPDEKLEDLCTRFFKVLNIEIKSLHCNPAGDWSLGGFDADAGLTGRKLAVDNYGPRVPLGGGAFSGKDATKVDRSAAYMARRIAVDYLKEFKAKEVLVRLAYAIGYDEPLEATAIVDGSTTVIRGYDLSPKGIIKFLDLNKPIFSKTAEWGHMGNNFKWL